MHIISELAYKLLLLSFYYSPSPEEDPTCDPPSPEKTVCFRTTFITDNI